MIGAGNDVRIASSSGVNFNGPMNVSLRTAFHLDWKQVANERERNMLRYNFTHSKNGVDKRTNLSLQEFLDVYDGKWLFSLFSCLDIDFHMKPS